MRRSLFLFLLILATTNSVATLSYAQPVGAPILTESDRRFSLSFNTGYLREDVFGVRNTSPRFLFKGIYGFGDRLDVFGKLGVAKLLLRAPQSESPDFTDGYHLALGGGFTFRYLTLKSLRMSLFINGQVFRFTSNPTSRRNLILGGSSVTQEVEFEYDWREVDFSAGFIRRLGNLKLYGGFNSKMIQRLETRNLRNIIGGSESSATPEEGEYFSGLQVRPFLGVDILLPSRYFISAEIITKGRRDFLITLGITQTGKP